MGERGININSFKEKLQHPSSKKLLDQILYFLEYRLTPDLPRSEKSARIHALVEQFEKQLGNYSCWRGSDWSEIDESSEALEYIITREKYKILFETEPVERNLDEQLMLAFNSFEFIKPRHLDILIPPDKEIIFTPAIERMIYIR